MNNTESDLTNASITSESDESNHSFDLDYSNFYVNYDNENFTTLASQTDSTHSTESDMLSAEHCSQPVPCTQDNQMLVTCTGTTPGSLRPQVDADSNTTVQLNLFSAPGSSHLIQDTQSNQMTISGDITNNTRLQTSSYGAPNESLNHITNIQHNALSMTLDSQQNSTTQANQILVSGAITITGSLQTSQFDAFLRTIHTQHNFSSGQGSSQIIQGSQSNQLAVLGDITNTTRLQSSSRGTSNEMFAGLVWLNRIAHANFPTTSVNPLFKTAVLQEITPTDVISLSKFTTHINL